MRDDPYPSRYYPRLEEEPLLDATEAPISALAPLRREARGLISTLLALYLLVAILFVFSNRAEAAPLNSAPAAAPAWSVMGESCVGEASLAHK
jgi:hypothetical protein